MRAMAWWLQVLVTGLWGGALALERRAFLQAMASRPLVAGTGLGLVLSDVTTGLYVGLLFELFHLGGVSLGGTHPDHETLSAVTASGMAVAMGASTGSHAEPAMWAVAILTFAPAGWLGRVVEARLDLRASRYIGREKDAVAGNRATQGWQNVRAMWPQFTFYGLLSAAAVGLGWLVGPWLEALPSRFLTGLAWAYPAMGTVAAAVAVRSTNARRSARWGAAAAALVFGSMLALQWRPGAP